MTSSTTANTTASVPPSQPLFSNLQASNVTATSFTLQWSVTGIDDITFNQPSNVSSLVVYVSASTTTLVPNNGNGDASSTNNGNGWTRFDIPTLNRSYTLVDLQPGMTYRAFVRASTTKWGDVDSTIISVTTPDNIVRCNTTIDDEQYYDPSMSRAFFPSIFGSVDVVLSKYILGLILGVLAFFTFLATFIWSLQGNGWGVASVFSLIFWMSALGWIAAVAVYMKRYLDTRELDTTIAAIKAKGRPCIDETTLKLKV